MYLCLVLSSLILAPPLSLPCPSPSVYLGHHTYLINPYDLETNPALWMSTVSQYKGRRGGAGPEEIWPLTMCMPCTLCLLHFCLPGSLTVGRVVNEMSVGVWGC